MLTGSGVVTCPSPALSGTLSPSDGAREGARTMSPAAWLVPLSPSDREREGERGAFWLALVRLSRLAAFVVYPFGGLA